MDILYLLVPVSVLLALALLALFCWALDGGQFDDIESEGERILGVTPAPTPSNASSPGLDAGQAPGGT